MEKFNELVRLLEANRSYRRFDASRHIDSQNIIDIISLARLCASGRNLQPLKYRIVTEKDELDKVFPLLKWAGYLPEWDGPEVDERPTAYLIQCLDTELTQQCLCDDGLQIEALTLGAVAKGLGCCIIKSFNIPELVDNLGLPSNLRPLYVIAIGYPIEKVMLEEMKDNDVKYYRTPDQVHHVPKRDVKSLIIKK